MLTENEKRLIEVIAEANLGASVAVAVTSVLDDDQMPEVTNFIREKLAENKKVTENDVAKAVFILKGEIELEE